MQAKRRLAVAVNDRAPIQVSDPLSGASATAGADLIERVTVAMFEVLDDFAPVFTRQLLKRVPELGSVDDEASFEANRKSALGSMYEFICIARAGLTEPSAIETSPEALEHLRFLQARGVGMKSLMRFYHVGLSMFGPLMLHELERVAPDRATVDAMSAQLSNFVFTYVDQITKRLAAEYGTERDGWVADPDDPVWHDPDSVAEVNRFIGEISAKERAQTAIGAAACAYTEAALDRFCSAMEAAAQDERLSSVLARADTTVRICLADDPELCVTLLLDRNPIEVVESEGPAEVEIWIVSVDLARLYSPDFHLSMAISRGRVKYTGPVRKFLRVTPVVRHASLPKLIGQESPAGVS
jgi:hypothetical protein